MKVTMLIDALQAIVNQHGDAEVWLSAYECKELLLTDLQMGIAKGILFINVPLDACKH